MAGGAPISAPKLQQLVTHDETAPHLIGGAGRFAVQRARDLGRYCFGSFGHTVMPPRFCGVDFVPWFGSVSRLLGGGAFGVFGCPCLRGTGLLLSTGDGDARHPEGAPGRQTPPGRDPGGVGVSVCGRLGVRARAVRTSRQPQAEFGGGRAR